MYKNIAIQSLHSSLISNHEIHADVMRLDLIHPQISGNKWFKLKYYLEAAIDQHAEGLISFGGAYSNHLVALAYACQQKGLKSSGIIRGEAPAELNHSLEEMIDCGMSLQFVSREAYRDKCGLRLKFNEQYPGYYPVDEGGRGELGVKGAGEILLRVPTAQYTHILCAVGTATTMAGLVNTSAINQQVMGISALKVPDHANNELLDFLKERCNKHNYLLNFNYHFGGYAKKNPILLQFMQAFEQEENIPLDFVYTGKLFFAFSDLTKQGYFPSGSRILLIHSGGLLGNRSLTSSVLTPDF
ncbi:MAG TPA: pyridoxal-phosphate dependent enzyme [Flavitalea sp.]|nr:pyridoxal-phosphate dependent enzyme [Flavitalea sp.]